MNGNSNEGVDLGTVTLFVFTKIFAVAQLNA